MAGMYRPRHLERTVLYRVLFHYFDRFLTDCVVVDRIIDHPKLTFVAERPPPPQIAYQESLVAAEASGECFS
jgi:hypothetical protein